MTEGNDNAAPDSLSLRAEWLCLSLILLAAAALRLYGITDESAWTDEAVSLRFIEAPGFLAYFKAYTTGTLPGHWEQELPDKAAPVYFFLQYYWASMFGTSVLAARTFSLVLGLAAILLVHGLARTLFSPRVGLLSAGLMALSVLHVYYAQEVRFYALITFLAVLSFLALVQALYRRKRAWWVIHAFVNALLLWTHPVTALVMVGQGVYLMLFDYRPWRRSAAWFGFHATLAVAFFLWLQWLGYGFAEKASAYDSQALDWRDFPNALLAFAGGRFSKLNPAPYMATGYSADGLIAALVLILAALPAIGRLRQTLTGTPAEPTQGNRPLALLYCWAVIPPVALFVIALTWRHVFFLRYVLHSAVPLSMLAAAGLMRLRFPDLRRGLALLLFALLAYQNLFIPRPFRPDFRSAVTDIEAAAKPDAVMLPFKHLTAIPVRLYTSWPGERTPHHQGYGELLEDALRHLRKGHEIWAIFHLWEKTGDFTNRLREQGYSATQLRYDGIPPLLVVHAAP